MAAIRSIRTSDVIIAPFPQRYQLDHLRMSDQCAYEAAKDAHELKLRQAERAHDRNDEMADIFNQSADRNSQAAIRIVLAINGGAAIALLAFTGGLASRSNLDLRQLSILTHQLKWFVYGVLVSCVAAASAYITTYCGAGEKLILDKIWEYPYILENKKSRLFRRVRIGFHILGFISAIAGLVIFAYGMHKVQKAVGNLT